MIDITDVEILQHGEVTYRRGSLNTQSKLSLWLIREAWGNGCGFEDLADGFGLGLGTNGDWSAIRDSSPRQQALMLERAMNFVQCELKGLDVSDHWCEGRR